MNKGGKVPGSGNTDTVPAMLTPGEFVMSKGAVQQYGVDTLEGMNAAAGGTNKPKMGRYNEGGSAKSPDKSHFGKTGYRMGQVRPDMYVYGNEKFVSTYKTKDGKVIEESEDYTEITGSIADEELISNQKQLMGEINSVEGYENANIIDVMERMNGRGRLVDMPDETLYPILNASDAWKATDAKRDEGIRMDQEAGTSWLDPREGEKLLMNAGGLVPGYAGGGLVGRITGSVKNISGRVRKALNPPVRHKHPVTVSYDNALLQQQRPLGAPPRQDLPSFDAGAMVSMSKIKTLGISV